MKNDTETVRPQDRRNPWRSSVRLVLAAVIVSGCRESQNPPPPVSATGTTAGEAPVEIFTDIAAETGLDFVHMAGGTGEFYFPEISAGGSALWDYDNDGDLDVYLIQAKILGRDKSREDLVVPYDGPWPPRNRLYRNDLGHDEEGHPRLRFTDVTDESGLGDPGYGMGCAVGDYDNDGHLDLYLTNFGHNVLYRNRGNGTFEDVTERAGVDDERWTASASFVDYDRDGDLDLFMVNYVNFSVDDNKPCFGMNSGREYCGPTAHEPVPDRLFRNQGDGTFVDVTTESGVGRAFGAGLGICCADLNGDGLADCYVANDAHPNQYWLNQGNGTFEDAALLSGSAMNEYGLAEAGMGIAIADFDWDGDNDIILTHLREETNTLYVNEGEGVFIDGTVQAGLATPSLRFTGFGVEWIDFDNDGLLDLFVANGDVTRREPISKSPFPYGMTNQLFRNLGQGRFAEVTQDAGNVFDLVEASRGASIGDVDNDGDRDVLVVNANGPVRLLRNNVGQDGNWINVRAVQTLGSRDAIGARVGAVRRDGRIQWRRVHSDGSIQSAHDLRVQFGLGRDVDVESMRVQWPDGSTEQYEAPPIRSFSTLRQGEGTPIGP